MNDKLIALKEIHDNPYQGRVQYDDIEALGRSIAVNGLEQTPKARMNGKGCELKFGHRRKRAFDWLALNWKTESLPERYDGYSMMPLELGDFSDREMFDAVVIENTHRDDLKPTEEARLMVEYQQTFPEATSKDIGLVFNKSDATVRGMIRLLELPAEAQKSLDEGRITQGTARSLLSMQKIASADAVAATIKEIEENDIDSPEYVIDSNIDQLENSVNLWNERSHDSKPRSGRHGWLLSMKNFPNNLLPVLDEQATAGMTEEQIEHLTTPPSCNVCPFYTKVRGSHYCGMRNCHERKTAAWSAYLLEQASKQLDIPIWSEADGVYRALDSYSDTALFNKKHKDLRLIAKRQVSGYHWQNWEGINDDVFLAVATGEALSKLKSSSTSKGGKKTEKEKAEARALRLYRQLRKEAMWEYCGTAQKHFDGIPLSVLEIIEEHSGYVGVDDRIPKEYEVDEKAKTDAKMDFKRREIVWNLIYDLSSYYSREPLAEQLEAFADRMAISAPKALIKKVQAWDAEIEAAAKVVSTATPARKGKK